MTAARAGWLAAAAMAVAAVAARPPLAADTAPVVHDARLELSLVASDPDIVTPIGIATDRRGRLFVLESHTHHPPPGYAGPKTDRVKVFADRDGDGRLEGPQVFAEGFEDGMQIAFSPAGVLCLVTSRAVWALHDQDGDGVSERRTRLLHMVKPASVYDHAGLLGLAFSPDGWLYVSRGNTGGAAWRIEGTDGRHLRGYGDGGNIVRSRPDGAALEEVATGFWNPFDLKFDRHGRLLASDNDPDSRGPNRLVHVISGGDYGYRSLFGQSGIHPYVAWNGELPGTLPYAAALGEAPAGMLVAAGAALPAEYRDDLIVSIWEEHRVVRVRLTPRGASVAGSVAPLIDGGGEFRPVAFAADANGIVYFTDWVVREYPNHGRGRLWRLGPRAGVTTMAREPPGGAPALAPAAAGGEFARLREDLRSADPFVRAAAITTLTAPALRRAVVEATADAAADVRLGALLALQRAGHDPADPIVRRLLGDPDPRVRQMALIWAGTAGLTGVAGDLDRAIAGEPTPALFETYLATVPMVTAEFTAAKRAERHRSAKEIPRPVPGDRLAALASDSRQPLAVRTLAVQHLDDLRRHLPLLERIARDDGALPLRVEAVRALAWSPGGASGGILHDLVRHAATPPALRAEAWVALGRQQADPDAPASAATRTAIAALDDGDADVRLEAARYLRTVPLDPASRAALERRLAGRGLEAPVRAQLALVFPPLSADAGGAGSRPASKAAWAEAARAGGRADRGRRVFLSQQAACAQCHVFERRGGDLGPDLSNVGASKTRAQLVAAILQPSAEITPEYQGWYIRTADGETHTGRQIDVAGNGRAELYVLSNRFVTFDRIVEYGAMNTSLMPEGLETNLSVDDMRDLVAFLGEAGGRGTRPATSVP